MSQESEKQIQQQSLQTPKEKELIKDSDWENWLEDLVQFLKRFESSLDIISFLNEIRHKIEDCSRCYTAMWTLDMLHENAQKLDLGNKTKVFKDSINTLQSKWNRLYKPIRETRKELLGEKCIIYFNTNFKYAVQVIGETPLPTSGYHDTWVEISKRAHEQGWTDKKEYKDFLGLLMIEMAKY